MGSAIANFGLTGPNVTWAQSAGVPSMVMPTAPAPVSNVDLSSIGSYGQTQVGASNPLGVALRNVGPSQAAAAAGQVEIDPLTRQQIPATPNAAGGPASGAGALPGGELGWNMDTMKLGLAGIQVAGNLYGAWQAQKLAKENLAMQRDFGEQNMANAIMAYNTTLQDKMRGRVAAEAGQAGGTSQAQADEYLRTHELQRRRTS
jgi:hypothetical protein